MQRFADDLFHLLGAIQVLELVLRVSGPRWEAGAITLRISVGAEEIDQFRATTVWVSLLIDIACDEVA
jgi:hypothetical protein